MTNRQDQLARAVFDAVFLQARNLTLSELMFLRSIYSKDSSYEQLTPALKEKFLNLGMRIVTVLSRQQTG